jgi:hypothetical protein
MMPGTTYSVMIDGATWLVLVPVIILGLAIWHARI